jgi:magnesium-transporting ATPase (P-type)
MANMKQNKHNNIKEKAIIAKKNEKVINDFLLQFAYTLMIGVISIFMYNAANFRYGSGAYDFSNKLMWIVFAISLILCILFAALYKIKSNGKYKITSIYALVTALVAFWYVGVQEVVYRLNIAFLSKFFTGAPKIILCIFPALGLALVVEFAVYFIRYYSINRKK